MSPGGRRQPRRAVAAVCATLLAAGAGGCGGATVSGRRVFAQHCELCHSISGTSTPEQQGGDLRGLRLPRRELVQYTVEMPVIRSRLTAAEVRAVVDYMRSVTSRR